MNLTDAKARLFELLNDPKVVGIATDDDDTADDLRGCGWAKAAELGAGELTVFVFWFASDVLPNRIARMLSRAEKVDPSTYMLEASPEAIDLIERAASVRSILRVAS